MTKSTKIIAALGVAAGLGIAALPAGAIFADATLPLTYDNTTSANVEVELNVSEGIAIGVSASKCVADSGDAEGIQNFTISDAGTCAMTVAGGTNGKNGFTLSVATAQGATSYLVLHEGDPAAPVSNPTDKQKIAATAGELSANDDTKAGWNITGGKLTNHAVSSTAVPVMVTASPKQVAMGMTYNFATRSDQESGKYKTNITYTIAPNGTAVANDDFGTATPVDTYPRS